TTLTGKVAVVTGASRGIGAAIARGLAASGAQVVLASRKLEGVAAVAAEIEAAGGEALPVACHVGEDAARAALIEAALARFGKVDVLVNDAATNPHYGPLLELEGWSAWDKTFDVNLKGGFDLARRVALHHVARVEPGSLVNVGTVLGTLRSTCSG